MPDFAEERLRFFRPGSSGVVDSAFWEGTSSGDLGSPERTVGSPVEDIPVLTAFKYIDDTTIFVPADLSLARRHLSTGTTVERFVALSIGGLLDDLAEKE